MKPLMLHLSKRYPVAATFLALPPTLALAMSCHAASESYGPTAQDPPLEEVLVFGRAEGRIGRAGTASEGFFGFDDLAHPPLRRIGEYLEQVPGLAASQHSGTGKANQYFLRGFNLDHGTDFSAKVDGVPVNLRSHAHGQGYLDLNFLIPELVESGSYRKGPYHAGSGDFSSAGSVDLALRESFLNPSLTLTAGDFGYRRAMVAGSLPMSSSTATAAIDLVSNNGAWDLDEELWQQRLYLSQRWDQGFGVTLQSYDARWTATDQIPRRAIRSGTVNAFGFIDPDLGGTTHRHSLSADIRRDDWRVGIYAIDYDLQLYSNFTYFLEDSVNGDEFEQRDDRRIAGFFADASYRDLALDWVSEVSWGIELQEDRADTVGLYNTASRVRRSAVSDDQIRLRSLGSYGELTLVPHDAAKLILGVRADHYDWAVSASSPGRGVNGSDSIVSPSFRFVYGLPRGVELYAAWGRGFHSNDVRGQRDADPGAMTDDNPLLARSLGSELGLRFETERDFRLSMALYRLKLDSELVFAGDAGSTEAQGASNRTGFEASAFWRVSDRVSLDGSYSYASGKLQLPDGGSGSIPGSIPETLTLGASVQVSTAMSASIRLRHLSAAPLLESGELKSSSSTLVNVGARYSKGPYVLRLDILNLFDSEKADISYVYSSRLPGETQEGIEDVHLHPVEPLTARVSVAYRFGSG